MRSMLKRSMVTLAAAGALVVAGSGVASAAPAGEQAAPGLPELGTDNCVVHLAEGVATNPGGALENSLANPVAAVSDPVACTLTIFTEGAGGLPIPSLPF